MKSPFIIGFVLTLAVYSLATGAEAAPTASAQNLRLISVDEAAPESDPNHNSDPGSDLTYTYGWVAGDTLVVELDFASDWGDLHLMVALERNSDSAGGARDPFEFEIFYGHESKPDYVFTYKYSANDYGDLRRWNAGAWEWWSLQKRIWVTDETDPTKNAVSMVAKGGSKVRFAFPFDAVGNVASGDTLWVQTYVTQEPSGTKYNALDSSPHDSTHDMLPDVGEWWETATDPVALSVWAEWVIPAFGAPPTLANAAADPDTARSGDDVLFSVSVADAGGDIGDVTADLAALEGDAETPLVDDGTGGDETPSDGIYSALFTIPGAAAGGTYRIPFAARDASDFTSSTASASLRIETEAETFISAADSVGDDHGPNHTDSRGTPVSGLYYYYPTNQVFYTGVFDIEQADFFIEGKYLVARVYLGEVTSNSQVSWGAPNPGGTCTNPNKAQFNLQKIDIFIDSEEGTGATAGFGNRWADIAEKNAWEFAASVEGWWTALVLSNNENDLSGWTFRRSISDIDLCNDYVEDWVDVKMGLETLGLLDVGEDLTPAKIAEIHATVRQWDFIIAMSGHDGDSDNNNQGAIRVVNRDQAEWQFWGGRNTEGGRERDPNIIDILTIVGEGKAPGRIQEEMLDYTADEAWQRFDDGGVSCILEAQAEYPGSISGTVTLSDAGHDSTVITVEAYDGMRNSLWWSLPFIYSYGGNILTDDNEECALSEPGAVAGFQFKVDLYSKHRVEGGAWRAGGIRDDVGFQSRKYVMVFNGPWAVKGLEASGIDFGVALIPAGPAGRATNVGGNNLAILSTCRHPGEAYKFLRHIVSRESQARWANELGQIPVNRAADAMIDLEKHPCLGIFMEQMKYAVARPQVGICPEIENDTNPEMQADLDAKKTAGEAMQAACRKINAILEEEQTLKEALKSQSK
jgi:hypothetical protein